ncbi:DUF1275 family protein [Mesorhizobium sp. M1307]|uniref:YoaK family protein n=1 Tax=Mesorhizobium sp. M1307 TaxID=2957079 RepID=UPI00333C956F
MLTKNDASAAQRSDTGLSVMLALVAGYVDVCTFLAFAGFFVAQVTGSYVVAGSGLFGDGDGLGVKVLAIPVFLLAGMVTTAIVRLSGPRQHLAMVGLLGLEAALLCGLTIASLHDGANPITAGPALFGLAAMGIQSATVRLLLPSSASTNVMTSNTTQMAIELVDSCRSRRPTVRLLQTGSVMLGFLAGIIAGALAHRVAGLACLGLAALALCALVAREILVVTAKTRPHAGSL